MKLSFREIAHHGVVGLLIFINTIGVKYMLVALSEAEMVYVSGKAAYDYYQAFRGLLLFCACVVLLLNFLSGVLARTAKLNFDRYTFLLANLIVVTGLSYLLSPYRTTADEGFLGTYEGVSVLISYGILALTTALMPLNKSVLRFYAAVFMSTLILVTGISLLQYAGADPLRWSIVKAYVTSAFMPSEPPDNGYGLSAHGFFSNPNYLSSYFSLLLPAVYFAFFRCKNHYSSIGLGLLILFAHFAVFASGSLSGLALVVVGMTLCWKMAGDGLSWKRKAFWHMMLLIPLVFFIVKNQGVGFGREALGAMVAYGVINATLILSPLSRFTGRQWVTLIGVLAAIPLLIFWVLPSTPPTHGLTKFEDKQGIFRMTIDGQEYRLASQQGDFEVSSGGKSIELAAQKVPPAPQTAEALPFHIESDRIQDRSVYKLMPFGIRFEVEQNKLFYLNSAGRRDAVEQPRFFGPEGYGDLATGRMYIWQHTLPLIADHPFLGTGPDTFALVFPQNDVVSKIRYIGNPYALATKAHNSYLNNAVNLGLIGMLIFIGLQAAVLQGLYRASFIEPENLYIKALFCGLLMFALMGLANDSRIFLAIYHWALLGLGIGLIRLSNYDQVHENNLV